MALVTHPTLPGLPEQAASCAPQKRPRSNSSSSSSSTASSLDDGSVFSQVSSSQSSDGSVSSCSSPNASKVASPLQTVSEADSPSKERPAKACRLTQACSASEEVAQAPTLSQEVAALASLEAKCSLASTVGVPESSTTQGRADTASPQPPQPCAGRSLFVDCLVDATVHVLDMIWHAPIHKSIAFLGSALDATSMRAALGADSGPIVRPCRCPVGAPLTGGIPLDVFIRETLRRSRTSCSTLQAALLYCKRVGGEVVRKRAELEGVALSADALACLSEVAAPHLSHDAEPNHFPSLTDGLEGTSSTPNTQAQTSDPLMCSRRTFLAAVVVSSKFVQDRTYSNRAWSKISGLHVRELGAVERRMLNALAFDLAATDDEWTRWTRYLSGEWKTSLESCRCSNDKPRATAHIVRSSM